MYHSRYKPALWNHPATQDNWNATYQQYSMQNVLRPGKPQDLYTSTEAGNQYHPVQTQPLNYSSLAPKFETQPSPLTRYQPIAGNQNWQTGTYDGQNKQLLVSQEIGGNQRWQPVRQEQAQLPLSNEQRFGAQPRTFAPQRTEPVIPQRQPVFEAPVAEMGQQFVRQNAPPANSQPNAQPTPPQTQPIRRPSDSVQKPAQPTPPQPSGIANAPVQPAQPPAQPREVTPRSGQDLQGQRNGPSAPVQPTAQFGRPPTPNVNNPITSATPQAPVQQNQVQPPQSTPTQPPALAQKQPGNQEGPRGPTQPAPPKQGGGGIAPGNVSSLDNPFNTMNQQQYDTFTRESQQAANQNQIRPAKQGGGGIAPGNVSSLDNPINKMSQGQYQAYSQQSQQAAQQNPLKAGGGGGVKPGNESSADNPFNTMSQAQYQNYAQMNKQLAEQDKLNRGAGGGIKPGNVSSADNPFNTLNQNQYDAYSNMSKQMAEQNPLNRGGAGSGGGLKPGNVSSADNPFNTMSQAQYDAYSTMNKQLAEQQPLTRTGGQGGEGVRPGNISSPNNPLNPASNPPTRQVRFQDDQQAMPEERGGYADDYSYLPPKERLAAKRKDHYQQGSNTSSKYDRMGGVDRSNDTSLGNTLAGGNEAMKEYYKQMNTEMVRNNPIKKGGRGAMEGGLGGGPIGGDANDGVTRKRGGMAMNL